jgi:hypothetical protein
MKKLAITAAAVLLAIGSFAPASQAYESRRDRDRNYREAGSRSDYQQLRAELYQLDIQFYRVDAHLRYRLGRQSRWEYSRLLRDRQRLNFELQRRPLDRARVHRQIDRLRDELRQLEVRLRFRGPHRY